MADVNQRSKEIAKIRRTLVRLKYSLQADRELNAMDEEAKRLAAEGLLPSLEVNLTELLTEQ